MSLSKNFLKTKPECKVTFKLSKDECADAKQINLVGDFNQWDEDSSILKKNKSGDFSISVNLEVGKDYQFRYLIDGEKWMNEKDADYYAPTEYNSENSVVKL